jgi:hypothetical protein
MADKQACGQTEQLESKPKQLRSHMSNWVTFTILLSVPLSLYTMVLAQVDHLSVEPQILSVYRFNI